MRKSLWSQIAALFCVVNLSLSAVLANLYHVDQSLKLPYQHEALVSRSRREENYTSQIGNLRGRPGEGYYLQVEIGTPPQKLNVIIDTGSSNFAVACEPNSDISTFFNRKQSSTFKELGRSVNVPYTQGSWEGVLGRDNVSISSIPGSSVVANIACITSASNFFINTSDWQGILGLAYADIARPDSSVDPLFDTLVHTQQSDNIFSVQLCGLGFISPNPDGIVGGSVIFGGISPQLYAGDLFPTPINKAWYYEVVIIDVEVAGQSLNMDCKEYNFGKTIVDTGTTNLRLPNRVFNNLVNKIKEHVMNVGGLEKLTAEFWSGDQVLCTQPGQIPYNKFPTVSVVLPSNSSAAFKLIIAPQHYLRPVDDSDGDPVHTVCVKLGISPLQEGSVLGAVVMEGFYTVFDRANNQVLFADTTCGSVSILAARSHVLGPVTYTGNYKDCAYKKPETSNHTLTIVGYVLAGICAVCLLPLIILLLQWWCPKCKCKQRRSNSSFDDLMEDSS